MSKRKPQDESDVDDTLYWIEELNKDTGKYHRLINRKYTSKQDAVNRASVWAFNEGRRLRVVEVRETMVASF